MADVPSGLSLTPHQETKKKKTNLGIQMQNATATRFCVVKRERGLPIWESNNEYVNYVVITADKG
jgi:hypothetical protein